LNHLSKLLVLCVLILTPALTLSQAMFFSQNDNLVPVIPAPAYETGCAEAAASGSTSTCAMTLVGGEAVAIYLQWVSASSTPTVTDSTGQTVTPALTQAYGVNAHTSMYYIQNATAGAHTVLVTMSTAVAYQIAATAYTGANTSGSLIDGTPTSAAFTTATNPFSCPAITTAQSNGVVIGMAVESSGSIVLNPGTGFTMRQKPSPEQGIEDKSTTTAGSYTASFATTTTTAAACMSMVFKHA
jgi:hypothetical protein